jgi:hypothetical protein
MITVTTTNGIRIGTLLRQDPDDILILEMESNRPIVISQQQIVAISPYNVAHYGDYSV